MFQVTKAIQVFMVRQEAPATRALQALQANRAIAELVHRVIRVYRVLQIQVLRVIRVILVILGSQVIRAFPVQEFPVFQVLVFQVIPDQQDHRAIRVSLVNQERKVHKDFRAIQANLEFLAIQATVE